MMVNLFGGKPFSQSKMAFGYTTPHILQKTLALQSRSVPYYNAWEVFPKSVSKTGFWDCFPPASFVVFRLRFRLLSHRLFAAAIPQFLSIQYLVLKPVFRRLLTTFLRARSLDSLSAQSVQIGLLSLGCFGFCFLHASTPERV